MDLYKNLETLYQEVVKEIRNKVDANGGEIELDNPIRVVNTDAYEAPIKVGVLRVTDGELELGCAFDNDEYDDYEEEEWQFESVNVFLSFHIEDLLYINDNI